MKTASAPSGGAPDTRRRISFFLLLTVWTVFCSALLPVAALSQEITIAAVGDIMMGSTTPHWWLPPDDGAALFESVNGYLKGADIVFGNLEGTLMDGGEPGKCQGSRSPWCFEFKTPTRYAQHLKNAGFNVLNIANNHAWDFGWEGVRSTLETLKGIGLQPAGGQALASFEIRGKRVALAGFSYVPTLYSYSLLEIGPAAEVVRKLKERFDLVIVSFHGGAEGKSAVQVPDRTETFLGENRGQVIRFSRAMIDAGADLVLGHGPHVLRAMELYKGKLVAYSLGNFLTYGYFNLKGPNGLSAILKIRLEASTGRFLDGDLFPVKLSRGGIPEADPEEESVRIVHRLSRNPLFSGDLMVCEGGRLFPGDGFKTCRAEGKKIVER
ncbi:MAG: CapA family protein [Deltaproteobacteria bacterium]|nr:CapA family protein [Deltaproteobacteria bacterium]